METTAKAERQELYRDRNTQVLLSKLLAGEPSEIEPRFDSKRGYRYEIVETIVGDASKAEAFLERLYEAGILARELHDEVIFCSKCNSAGISTRYCCPYCKSFNIKKSSLIEHIKCGYMDVEEDFHKGDKLICQKCHDELKKLDVDYKRAGTWCTCKECGKSFDIPLVKLFCRDCHNEFTFEDATIKEVYRYSLKEEARREAAEGCVLIPPISEFLAENGFEVRSPAFLKGKSGANHAFDIVASRKENAQSVTVIDLATSTDNVVSEQPVIALFAKIFDVSPHAAYLIAIPKLNDDAKKMAELYNIHAIEGKNQKEAMDSLKEKITQAK
ncbi:MAG: hypothetical protein ABSB89_06835 [Candidatus Bathyarchaeia archaeon]